MQQKQLARLKTNDSDAELFENGLLPLMSERGLRGIRQLRESADVRNSNSVRVASGVIVIGSAR
jgi:hypothetical protein